MKERYGKNQEAGCLNKGRTMPNYITWFSHLFKMDMLVMSIVILCIVSTVLYQVIAVLEKIFLQR